MIIISKGVNVIFYIFLGMLVELGMCSHVVGHNENVKDILCRVYTVAQNILNNANAQPGFSLKQLESAIFGTRGKAYFGMGVQFPYKCNNKPSGRGVLCNFDGGSGCFAESLLGTFMCVCTPGDESPSNLCGLSDWGDEKWSGGQYWDRNAGALFRKVWDKIIKNCSVENENVKDGAKLLEILEDAVNETTKKLKQGSGFSYLGESGCDRNGNNACASYHNGIQGNDVNIPWVSKIKKILPQLKEEIASTTKGEKERATSESESPVQPGPTVLTERAATPAAQSSPIPLETKEEDRETKPEDKRAESTENHAGEAPETRKQSSQNSSVTEILHLASYHNDDGSLLTQSFSLLWAALLL
ncbi:Variant surface glycoprotein [Trypanosoma congolense IL3000]|uniref:Variant surface glycoprotein n=1 Tax=Trypanosoma congolense (strain IL3000) TaxID=1068625 RepID=F9W684_TRYCI|nr:Variant surface glycoprotein [Trypanosoma congolense IL3000]